MSVGSYQKVSVAPLALLKQSLALMGDQYWLFLGITFVGMLIASLAPMGILYGPMMCGIYLCYFMRMGGKQVTFETLFKGFDVFLESLVATLIVIVVSMVVMVPLVLLFFLCFVGGAIAADEGGSPAIPILLLLVGVPFVMAVSLIVSGLFVFVYPLIIDKNMKAVQAVKTSCQAVMGNLMGVFWLLVVYSIFAVLAALACGIGTIFFTPVWLGAMALLYRQIFPVVPRTM